MISSCSMISCNFKTSKIKGLLIANKSEVVYTTKSQVTYIEIIFFWIACKWVFSSAIELTTNNNKSNYIRQLAATLSVDVK